MRCGCRFNPEPARGRRAAAEQVIIQLPMPKNAAILGCALAVGISVLVAQGMGGGPRAAPRPSAKARLDLPTPKVDFRDIASAAGLTAPNVYGGVTSKKYILEMTGNGAAIVELDNDGRPDIVLVGGARLDPPAPGAQSTRLYLNQGDGTFRDATANSGLRPTGWGQGVCAGDYDNDGLTDLLVTHFGHNVLYRNLGGGKLEDVTQKVGMPVTGNRWGTGCAFLDYDRDGHLDLFVANYLEFDLEKATLPGANPNCFWKGLRVFCGPRGSPGGRNVLYRSNRGQTFTDVTSQAGLTTKYLHYGLGVVSADFDDDGWPDIYVACDSTPSMLYRNNQDGTFTDVAVGRGTAYGPDGQEQGSMGVAAGDYDNDGRIDLVKTNFMDETSTLYRNQGKAYFADETYAGGLGVNTKFVGWGIEFIDFDQDGWKDLFLANGHIYPELEGSKVGEAFRQPKVAYWNLRNGAFRDVTHEAGTAVAVPQVSRGLATGDLDGDGSPEILVVNMNAVPSLYKNAGPRGSSILVQTIGTKSNRSAIGARITVVAGTLHQVGEVQSGGSYASQRDFRLHFGLGNAARVDRIEIRWPSGTVEAITGVDANQWIRIKEGEGIIKTSPFR